MTTPGEEYLRWYYDSQIWKQVSYRGVRTLKNVVDLWNYQEIIQERGIEWIVETGTRHGGSALYFADLLSARDSAGLVVSVDVDHDALQVRDGSHPWLRLIRGDSASAQAVSSVRALVDGRRAPLFVILDSDHRAEHVRRELEAYVPLMRRGDYLVIEDTCINGHPVRADFGPGPMEAVEDYLSSHPGVLAPDVARETKFGCTFAPKGHYLRS